MSPPDLSTQYPALSLQSLPFNPHLFDEAVNFAKGSILSSDTSLDTAPSSSFPKESISAPAWVDRPTTHSLDDFLSLSDRGLNDFFPSSAQPDYTTTFSPNYLDSSPTSCNQFLSCSPSDSTLRFSYLDPSLLTIQPSNESHDSGGDHNGTTDSQEVLPGASENPTLHFPPPSSWEQEDQYVRHNAIDMVLPNVGDLPFLEPQTIMPDAEIDLQAFQDQRLFLHSSESQPSPTGLLTDSPAAASTPALIVDGHSSSTSILVPSPFLDPNTASSQVAPLQFQSANHEKHNRESGKFLASSATTKPLNCPKCGKFFAQRSELQ